MASSLANPNVNGHGLLPRPVVDMQADDVATLVNVGVVCYLKQLLDTGLFMADPHVRTTALPLLTPAVCCVQALTGVVGCVQPGNLIRTPDGRLAILDFGLCTQIDDNIKFGMIEVCTAGTCRW